MMFACGDLVECIDVSLKDGDINEFLNLKRGATYHVEFSGLAETKAGEPTDIEMLVLVEIDHRANPAAGEICGVRADRFRRVGLLVPRPA